MPIKINGTNTAANPSITGTDTDTGIVYGSDQIDFSTGGTSKVTLNGSNLGVGTSSPTTSLHVQQSAVSNAPSRSSALYLENNANCEIQFVGNSSNDCQLRFGTSSNSFKGAIEYELDNNNLEFVTDGSERMRIDSSGNVGIGTTSPSAALEVIDSTSSRSYSLSGATELVVERASDVNLSLITTNTHNSRVRFGDTDDEDAGAIDYDHNVNNLNFFTNGGFRAKIDSAGKMIFGTPTLATSVSYSIITEGRLQSEGTAGLTTSSSANVFINSSTGLFARSTSSSRYKKDIADATWGLADVLKLKPKTFKSNATGENADDKTYAGFIAEDVHDIGLTNFVEYNSSDQPDAIHYGNMVALMAKAIQELNTKVTTLETKVAALEAA